MIYRFLRRPMYALLWILVSLGLIVLLVFLIYSPPRLVIYVLGKLHPDVLFDVDIPPHQRCAALTIDDFPNANDLSVSFRLLDTLRRYQAHCTFFTIGANVKAHEGSPRIRSLFEQLTVDGHEIGNHGWRDEKAIHLSQSELEQQILDTRTIIDGYTSSRTPWFRPGSGFFNRTMIQLCTKLGYRLVLGSIYPHDPQISSPRLNSFFIEHKLYPGAIVILHDRPITVETLERVLPAIEKRQFRLVTLTELTQLRRDA